MPSTRSQPTAYNVVQLTDCHLGASAGETLMGMDTDHSLKAVIGLLREQQPEIDLLIISGDLAAEGDAAAYRRLQTLTQSLARRVVWLPGNHDDLSAMLSVAGQDGMPFRVSLGTWQLLFFDSRVDGQVGGQLKETELQQLCAGVLTGTPALVFMHHHLVPIDCAWLDEQRIGNADDFFTRLAAAGGAEAVICGHVHQDWQGWQDSQRLLATPSTCIQFAPGSERFALDDCNPGYRWLRLGYDGTLETGVERVVGHFTVNHSADGYR